MLSTRKSLSTDDLALLEHPAEVLGGDRLGEGARQRCHVDELDPVAQAVLAQPRLGEEGELQRSDRALDRHVGDVHDQAAVVERRQRVGQGLGAVEAVEVEDALAPLAPQHAGGLVRPGRRAGRDDEEVVVQGPSVGEVHGIVVGVDPVDLAEHELDALWHELVSRPADLRGVVGPERQEQVARLVGMHVVTVDDGDLPLLARQLAPQLVDDHRARGPGTQHHQSPRHGVSPRSAPRPALDARTRCGGAGERPRSSAGRAHRPSAPRRRSAVRSGPRRWAHARRGRRAPARGRSPGRRLEEVALTSQAVMHAEVAQHALVRGLDPGEQDRHPAPFQTADGVGEHVGAGGVDGGHAGHAQDHHPHVADVGQLQQEIVGGREEQGAVDPVATMCSSSNARSSSLWAPSMRPAGRSRPGRTSVQSDRRGSRSRSGLRQRLGPRRRLRRWAAWAGSSPPLLVLQARGRPTRCRCEVVDLVVDASQPTEDRPRQEEQLAYTGGADRVADLAVSPL